MQQKLTQSKLLILSHSVDHASILLKAIVKSLPQHLNNKLLIELEEQNHDETKSLNQPLCLSTKYYDAEITVILAKYDHFIGDESHMEAKIETFKDQFGVNILDGILFVTQVMQPSKILGLHDFVRICDTIITLSSPNLQAVIYDKPNNMKVDKHVTEEQEAQLDNYVESIYEDFDNFKVQNQSGKPLQDAEDSNGISRVIEILECTMWLSMVKKSPTTKIQPEQQQIQGTHPQVNLMKQTFDEDDLQMDDLVQILNEMRDMKANTQNLDDDARRLKAENLINQLMKAYDSEDIDRTSSDDDK